MAAMCLLAGLLAGCLPEGGGGRDDDEAPVVDAGPGADAQAPAGHDPRWIDPEDANQRFATAGVRAICTVDTGTPALWVRLAARDVCGDPPPDRLELTIAEHPELPIPFALPAELPVGPDRPVQGHFVDARGERWPLLAGTITVLRVDPIEGASGRYDVQAAEGRRVVGAFVAAACDAAPGEPPVLPPCFPEGIDWPEAPEPEPEPPPEPEPEPEPEPPVGDVVPCPGSYGVTEWVLDPARLGFQARYIQPLLDGDLAAGALLLDFHFAAQPDTLAVIDAAVRGGPPAGDAPPIPPMALARGPAGQHFETLARGPMPVWLSATNYPGAMPLVWDLLDVGLVGRFDPDCSGFTAEFSGMFDGTPYSIPGAYDADTDGDGVPNGYRVFGRIEGTRFEPAAP